jgi:hypothetical protein
MIVYLLTILVAGAMNARVIVATPEDCQTLARRMLANDPAAHGKPSSYQCEALPMLFRSVDPPQTPH